MLNKQIKTENFNIFAHAIAVDNRLQKRIRGPYMGERVNA